LLLWLSKRAGVHLSPYFLRCIFASLALQGGMNLVSLKILVGYTSLETTRHIIQWLDADLLEAHRQAIPIGNLKQ
jgi:site-specific recombinase XerD